MSLNLFGTDGIRGLVNQHPITPEVILKFGIAAGIYFSKPGQRSKVLIAKDTRLSGYLIEPALTSGLVSVGVDVILLGPMPTPALAMLIKSLRADFGIMISASHNPYYDNGLKLFDSNSNKLSDKCEIEIQNLILSSELKNNLAAPDKLGRVARLDDALGRYIEYVKNSFLKHKTLSGLRIVIDCANGSAYKLAPTILWELGAEVISIGCEPNGFNINENCGSTYPLTLSQKVMETRADIGIALDGDADRVVICDEKGEVISGDHLIAAIALYMHQAGSLKSGVVVTQISNTALDDFLAQHGVAVYRSKVGDRYVAAEMRKRECNLGGEQSGHIIISDYSTAGDGVIAALQVLSLLVQSEKKASYIGKMFSLNPQVAKNIKFTGTSPLEDQRVLSSIKKIQSDNKDLQIIVRKSGTERLLRVMVEGKDINIVNEVANNIEQMLSPVKQNP
ncbi:MAG: phosphoglucosamine mutase [Candidatus Midichloria sp.]|nr:phosphoglucosamine mutase [Candidatus Midichloria sp.]